MEDGQGNRCLANPSRTNKSDRCEIACKTDNLLDQFVPPEANPQGWGRWFSEYAGLEREMLYSPKIGVANLMPAEWIHPTVRT
jgi:hypothetical protein